MMVGQRMYGYCGGRFGRDHYGESRIEAVGYDWVVVRNQDGHVYFASSPGAPIEEMFDEEDFQYDG